MQRSVALDLNPRGFEEINQRLFHPVAADPIEQDMHPHSSAGALGEGLGKSITDFT